MIAKDAPAILEEVSVHSNKVEPLKRWPYLCAITFLALCGFAVARIPVRPELAVVSSLFVVVFTIPSFHGLVRWLGWRAGARTLIMLGGFAIGLESFAVCTGIPYGDFHYSERIGVLVFGLVPWTVPFAWTPLLLTTFTLAQRGFQSPRWTPVMSAVLLVAIDLVLDPAAVGQKFWTWSDPGAYFGVPLVNFVGWFFSGLAGSWLLRRSFAFGPAHRMSDLQHIPSALLSSGILILSFWTSVCFWMEMWVPAAIGFALLLLCGREFFGASRQFQTEVVP